MQPLDYLFELLILVTLSYRVYAFWRDYIRINKKTIHEDDLIRAYTTLQAAKRRKSNQSRLSQTPEAQVKSKSYFEQDFVTFNIG